MAYALLGFGGAVVEAVVRAVGLTDVGSMHKSWCLARLVRHPFIQYRVACSTPF